jgi:hypothetical protein
LKRWREENPSKRHLQRQREYQNNAEKLRAYAVSYRAANPEKTKLATKAWAEKVGRDHLNAKSREKYSESESFRSARLLSSSVRHKRLRQSTPCWVSKESIKEVFLLARRKTEETGIPHVVDHVIPIRGKSVSGLTVPWNLRVITASSNCRKSNLLVEDIV